MVYKLLILVEICYLCIVFVIIRLQTKNKMHKG